MIAAPLAGSMVPLWAIAEGISLRWEDPFVGF
jgi:hypothetical protein